MKRIRLIGWILGILLLLILLFWLLFGSSGLKGYYEIGFIINSKEMQGNDMQVVRKIISQQLRQINANGGVRGRELRVRYLDDEGSPEVAHKLVEETIQDSHLIAYIGCWSSARTLAFAPLLKAHRVPILGGYALTPLFEDYSTIFTTETGIQDVLDSFSFLIRQKAGRVAFIGKADDFYSKALAQRLLEIADQQPKVELVLERWYSSDHEFTEQELQEITDTLQGEADFLVISFESAPTVKLVTKLRTHDVTVPIFAGLAEIGPLVDRAEGADLGELYDLTVSGIPGALNLRLREQIDLLRLQMKNVLEHQVTFSARYADAIGMIAESAKAYPEKGVRESIVGGLQQYVGGRSIYHGYFADWYFNEDRSPATDMLVAWKKPSLPHTVLAPSQMVHTQDTIAEVPVYYIHLNMQDLDRVNDTEGTFYASFYMELSSVHPIQIEHFDFTNAARNQNDHERLLEIVKLRERVLNHGESYYNALFKVSGKFHFQPDLQYYPYDQQKFPISFQPSSTLNQFLIQPSEVFYKDSVIATRGWQYKGQFVGYDYGVIHSVEPYEAEQYLLQFYKFNYTYLMERTRVDFLLKVLTPLLVILTITYFSVYIPLHKFETLEAIQVTSLLASIALYFSSYKPQMESATVSDKIFIFTYLMITSLIGTSILQYVRRNKYGKKSTVASVYQRIIFPLIIIVVSVVLISK
ncbi:MAG: ABC transporter substrate-binding protein [Pontibacter sp.]|nr:ABC transporter substrate-binding protein [Pontibacter sp.]